MRLFIPIAIILLASSCANLKLTPAQSTTSKPLRLYNPSEKELHPDYVVYHSGVDESTLYFRLLSKELLFNQANPDGENQSRVLVSYMLYSSFADQVVDQKGEKSFTISRDAIGENYIGSLKIPTENGKSYLLEVIVTDQIRQLMNRKMILVDRFNPKSQQNFLIVNYPANDVSFERFYYPSETFRIVTQDPPARQMRIAYYLPVEEIPAPPFSDIEPIQTDPEPDSVWTIQNTNQNLFRLEMPGVYQLYLEENGLNGVYVTNLGLNFPQVQKVADMIPPLKYITSGAEYEKIKEKQNRKQAVDDFWLDRAGSFTAARELIQIYYTRVVFANLYFSTDRQGWQTDRGMIYVLMGPPNLVNKSETGESWVYKQSSSNQKYTFDFYLASDPIKGYEFVLKRSENHRNPWNMAVESWRDGHIFSLQ